MWKQNAWSGPLPGWLTSSQKQSLGRPMRLCSLTGTKHSGCHTSGDCPTMERWNQCLASRAFCDCVTIQLCSPVSRPREGQELHSLRFSQRNICLVLHACVSLLYGMWSFPWTSQSVYSSRSHLDLGGDGGEVVGSRKLTAEGIKWWGAQSENQNLSWEIQQVKIMRIRLERSSVRQHTVEEISEA